MAARQIEGDRCPSLGTGRNGNRAAGLLGEALNLAEPKSGAFAHLLGGKKRLKDVRQVGAMIAALACRSCAANLQAIEDTALRWRPQPLGRFATFNAGDGFSADQARRFAMGRESEQAV